MIDFNSISTQASEIISKYINDGYILNPGTMAGTQGELSRVDLVKGNETIRVLIDKKYEDFKDYYVIRVLRYDCGLKISSFVLWNEKGETILDKWFMVLDDGSFFIPGYVFVGNEQDVKNSIRVKRERRFSRSKTPKYISSKYYPILIHFIKECNIPGFKRINPDKISYIRDEGKREGVGRVYYVKLTNGEGLKFIIRNNGYAYAEFY